MHSRVPGRTRAGAGCHREHSPLAGDGVSGSAGRRLLPDIDPDGPGVRAPDADHDEHTLDHRPAGRHPAGHDPATTAPLGDTLLASAVRAGLITVREVADRAVELRGSALLLHGQPIAYARPRRCRGAVGRRGPRAALPCGCWPRPVWCPRCAAAATSPGPRPCAASGWARSRGTMAELAEICQRWGAAIATLHLTRIAAASEPPVAPRPWVLDPDRLPRTMRQAPAGSARAFVLRTLRSDRGTAADGPTGRRSVVRRPLDPRRSDRGPRPRPALARPAGAVRRPAGRRTGRSRLGPEPAPSRRCPS